MYEPRTYRHWVKGKDLVPFTVIVKETDLFIRATSNLKAKATRLVLKYREGLEKYIEQHPDFLTSLSPVKVNDDAPRIAKMMARATEQVGVGPMASVAGAIAELVGTELLEFAPEVIVENGGDIFIKSLTNRIVGIYAGSSPLTGKINLEIDARDTPIGVCTSSGTVGPSLSLGMADAVAVVAPSAALADAAATAIGNRIREPNDISSALEFAATLPNLKGVLIIKDDKAGIWGQLKVC